MSLNTKGTFERTGDLKNIYDGKFNTTGTIERIADIWNPTLVEGWASGAPGARTVLTPATSETGYVHCLWKHYDESTTKYGRSVWSYNKTSSTAITLNRVELNNDSAKELDLSNDSGTIKALYSGANLVGFATFDFVLRFERGYSI
jgi:hypothetical protein